MSQWKTLIIHDLNDYPELNIYILYIFIIVIWINHLIRKYVFSKLHPDLPGINELISRLAMAQQDTSKKDNWPADPMLVSSRDYIAIAILTNIPEMKIYSCLIWISLLQLILMHEVRATPWWCWWQTSRDTRNLTVEITSEIWQWQIVSNYDHKILQHSEMTVISSE